MSEQWPGGLITKTPVTPSGPFEVSTASGVWTLEEAYQWKGDGLWPTAGNTLAYYTTYGILSGQGFTGEGIAADSSSNVYLSGWLSGTGSTYADDDIVWVSKWPSAGTAPTWQRSAQDTNITACEVEDSVIDSTSDIIIAVKATASTSPTRYAAVLKWDTDGTFQWGRNFGSTSARSRAVCSLGVDSSDNLYIWTNGVTSGFAQVVKWNSAGTIQWQYSATTDDGSIGNVLTTQDCDMAVDSSDYLLLGGWATTSTGGVVVGSIARVTAAGVLDWSREVTVLNEGVKAVATDSSDNVYISGQSTGPTIPYIMKFNSSGTRQWTRKIAGSASGTVWSQGKSKRMAVDASDNVYLIAEVSLNRSASGGPNNEAIGVFKYSSAGVLQWARYIQGNIYNMGANSRITIDGSDMVIGSRVSIDSADAGNMSMFYIKIPTDGSKTGDYTNPTYTGFTLSYGVLSVAESEDTTSTVATASYTLASTSVSEAATTMTSATGTLTYDNDPL